MRVSSTGPVNSSVPPERLTRALKALRSLLVSARGTLTPLHVEELIRGIAESRGPGVAAAEGVLTQAHAVRSAEAIKRLGEEGRASFEALLDKAGKRAPEVERALLYKALGARVEEVAVEGEACLKAISSFADVIRNKDRATLIARSSVVDLDADSKPEGLTQRFQDSCVPAVFQTARAEADPIYAWELTRSAVGSESRRTSLAREQKQWLEAAGGKAVPRGQSGGRGIFPEDLLGSVVSTVTGARYERRDVFGGRERNSALGNAKKQLEKGYDIAIVGGQRSQQHCLLLTDVRSANGEDQFLFQDVATGENGWVAREKLAEGPIRMGIHDDWLLQTVYEVEAE